MVLLQKQFRVLHRAPPTRSPRSLPYHTNRTRIRARARIGIHRPQARRGRLDTAHGIFSVLQKKDCKRTRRHRLRKRNPAVGAIGIGDAAGCDGATLEVTGKRDRPVGIVRNHHGGIVFAYGRRRPQVSVAAHLHGDGRPTLAQLVERGEGVVGLVRLVGERIEERRVVADAAARVIDAGEIARTVLKADQFGGDAGRLERRAKVLVLDIRQPLVEDPLALVGGEAVLI